MTDHGIGSVYVVERFHLILRVPSHDPGRTVLDQHLHRNHNYFGVCVKNKDHCVYLIKFNIFPAGAQSVPISREHIKRVLHKDEEEPPNNRPEDEIIEGKDVDNVKEKSGGKHNYAAKSIKAFVAMDATGINSANSFALRYGGKDSKVIN